MQFIIKLQYLSNILCQELLIYSTVEDEDLEVVPSGLKKPLFKPSLKCRFAAIQPTAKLLKLKLRGLSIKIKLLYGLKADKKLTNLMNK
jgi:hypothetical protein